jgi:hypothetical protein
VRARHAYAGADNVCERAGRDNDAGDTLRVRPAGEPLVVQRLFASSVCAVGARPTSGPLADGDSLPRTITYLGEATDTDLFAKMLGDGMACCVSPSASLSAVEAAAAARTALYSASDAGNVNQPRAVAAPPAITSVAELARVRAALGDRIAALAAAHVREGRCGGAAFANLFTFSSGGVPLVAAALTRGEALRQPGTLVWLPAVLFVHVRTVHGACARVAVAVVIGGELADAPAGLSADKPAANTVGELLPFLRASDARDDGDNVSDDDDDDDSDGDGNSSVVGAGHRASWAPLRVATIGVGVASEQRAASGVALALDLAAQHIVATAVPELITASKARKSMRRSNEHPRSHLHSTTPNATRKFAARISSDPLIEDVFTAMRIVFSHAERLVTTVLREGMSAADARALLNKKLPDRLSAFAELRTVEVRVRGRTLLLLVSWLPHPMRRAAARRATASFGVASAQHAERGTSLAPVDVVGAVTPVNALPLPVSVTPWDSVLSPTGDFVPWSSPATTMRRLTEVLGDEARATTAATLLPHAIRVRHRARWWRLPVERTPVLVFGTFGKTSPSASRHAANVELHVPCRRHAQLRPDAGDRGQHVLSIDGGVRAAVNAVGVRACAKQHIVTTTLLGVAVEASVTRSRKRGDALRARRRELVERGGVWQAGAARRINLRGVPVRNMSLEEVVALEAATSRRATARRDNSYRQIAHDAINTSLVVLLGHIAGTVTKRGAHGLNRANANAALASLRVAFEERSLRVIGSLLLQPGEEHTTQLCGACGQLRKDVGAQLEPVCANCLAQSRHRDLASARALPAVHLWRSAHLWCAGSGNTAIGELRPGRPAQAAPPPQQVAPAPVVRAPQPARTSEPAPVARRAPAHRDGAAQQATSCVMAAAALALHHVAGAGDADLSERPAGTNEYNSVAELVVGRALAGVRQRGQYMSAEAALMRVATSSGVRVDFDHDMLDLGDEDVRSALEAHRAAGQQDGTPTVLLEPVVHLNDIRAADVDAPAAFIVTVSIGPCMGHSQAVLATSASTRRVDKKRLLEDNIDVYEHRATTTQATGDGGRGDERVLEMIKEAIGQNKRFSVVRVTRVPT